MALGSNRAPSCNLVNVSKDRETSGKAPQSGHQSVLSEQAEWSVRACLAQAMPANPFSLCLPCLYFNRALLHIV